MRIYQLFLAGLLAVFAVPAAPGPARADLKICNNTGSRIGVAVGYPDMKGWTSEGWWNVNDKECETLLEGDLIARYYYVYAVDYDNGGSWGGGSSLCFRNKLFTIRGIDKCDERGADTTGFLEVDTGEEPDWTLSLSGPKTTEAKEK